MEDILIVTLLIVGAIGVGGVVLLLEIWKDSSKTISMMSDHKALISLMESKYEEHAKELLVSNHNIKEVMDGLLKSQDAAGDDIFEIKTKLDAMSQNSKKAKKLAKNKKKK